MRILDKNTDFYDYLQNMYPDDTFTFDRTDSFVLTKEIMCNYLYIRHMYSFHKNRNEKNYNFLLLQICNTFWLFMVELTEIDNFDRVKNYKIDLVTTWKNYDKKRVLCALDVIEFKYYLMGQLSSSSNRWSDGYDMKKVHEKSNILVQAVDTNDYRIRSHINKYRITYGDFSEVEKHIPLLMACGISNLIDPLDIYLSFEEYFSLEKQDSERREPIGTTDKDKIESHGFDTKISFRGKTR